MPTKNKSITKSRTKSKSLSKPKSQYFMSSFSSSSSYSSDDNKYSYQMNKAVDNNGNQKQFGLKKQQHNKSKKEAFYKFKRNKNIPKTKKSLIGTSSNGSKWNLEEKKFKNKKKFGKHYKSYKPYFNTKSNGNSMTKFTNFFDTDSFFKSK